MTDKFQRFLLKAELILADQPIFLKDRDKIMILNQKFRLNRDDCKLILKNLKKQPI